MTKPTRNEIEGLKDALRFFAASREGEAGPARYHPMNHYAEAWLTVRLPGCPEATKIRAYFPAAGEDTVVVYAIRLNGAAVEGVRVPFVR